MSEPAHRMSDAEPLARRTKVHLDIIEPDRGPLGLRNYPASKYPRRWVPQTIPLGWDGQGLVTATLHVPNPMTEREWEALLRALPVLKPGLVL